MANDQQPGTNQAKSNFKNERRTFNRTNNSTGLVGKLPPQALDLEQAILGALMLEKNAYERIAEDLHGDVFYEERHGKIFEAIKALSISNSPVDILTVTSTLRKAGELEMIGGAYYITELTNRVSSAANIEYHGRIIFQKYLQREAIRIGTEIINRGYDDTTDALELVDDAINAFKGIHYDGGNDNTEKDASYLVMELLLDQGREKTNGLLGYSTGFESLDYIMKGDQKGDVRIIAAATSMGKTALECSEVLNCCFDQDKELLETQIPVVVFNLEMKSVKFSIRLVSNLSSIEKDKISLNRLTPDETTRYQKYLGKFEQSKIYIEDHSELSINQFERKVAQLVKKYGIQKVYIDYVQLMKPDPTKRYGTRELELADIGRRLKSCAKKHDIVIVELLQLNDEVVKSKNCIPNLSHIRECKSLAHDADNVMFIWRPEYYESIIESLKEVHCSIFGNLVIDDFKNVAFVIVAKNREGVLGKVPIKFNGNIMRMHDHPLILNYMRGNSNLFSPSSDGEAPF